MGKVVAITSQKGGVGKTTTALLLHDCFRHMGYKSLVIDMDPQGNSTATMGGVSENENTIVDVMRGKCTAREAIQSGPMGDLLVGDPLLSQINYEIQSMMACEKILKKRIKDIRDDYDYIFIDTPPGLGIFLLNALTAADGVVIPLQANPFAVQGLKGVLDTIEEVRENVNEDLEIYGVLLTFIDERKGLDRSLREGIIEIGNTNGFRVFKRNIRVCQDIPNAQAIGDDIDEEGMRIIANRSMFDKYKSSNAAYDYKAVARELEEVIKNG